RRRGFSPEPTVQLSRLRLRRHAELALEDAQTDLVLLQRRRMLPLSSVEAHERTMRGFVERIEHEKAPRDLECAVEAALGRAPGEQRGEGAPLDAARRLALGCRPLVDAGRGVGSARWDIITLQLCESRAVLLWRVLRGDT